MLICRQRSWLLYKAARANPCECPSGVPQRVKHYSLNTVSAGQVLICARDTASALLPNSAAARCKEAGLHTVVLVSESGSTSLSIWYLSRDRQSCRICKWRKQRKKSWKQWEECHWVCLSQGRPGSWVRRQSLFTSPQERLNYQGGD